MLLQDWLTCDTKPIFCARGEGGILITWQPGILTLRHKNKGGLREMGFFFLAKGYFFLKFSGLTRICYDIHLGRFVLGKVLWSVFSTHYVSAFLEKSYKLLL